MKRILGSFLLIGLGSSVAVVYLQSFGALGATKSPIIFDHKKHLQRVGLKCLACHEPVQTSEAAADRLNPKEAVCLSCHNGTVAAKECKTCHINPDKPVTYLAIKREIIFSHKKHIEQKTACQTCHANVERTVVLTAANMPEMAVCLTCHTSQKLSKACATCHSEPQQMMAVLHPANWIQIHKFKANLDGDYCASCHRGQDLCQSCHRGDNYTGSIHPLNFKFTHGLEAKGKTNLCASCHETQSFCVACHQQELRMPLDHSDPLWVNRGDVRARNLHAAAARRDLERCAACHDQSQPNCAACHG